MVQSQASESFTIAGLARRGGVGVETVRYYQRRGLMCQPSRSGASSIRRYGAADVQRLRFIRAAQTAGFKLEEIAELLALDAIKDRKRARDMAGSRIAVLNVQIADMTAVRDSLSKLAKECGSGTKGPCPIITAFER